MKKPKLIVQILIALVLGVLMGIAFPVAKPDSKGETVKKELPGKKVEKKSIVSITDPSNQVEELNKNFKMLDEKISPPAKAEEPSSLATKMKIFIDIFMLLIKMIIAPLVFSVLVVGIAKLGDFKSVGRIGVKSLTYFISASLVSLMLGLVLVNLFEPGKHLPLATEAVSDIKVANVEILDAATSVVTGVASTRQSAAAEPAGKK